MTKQEREERRQFMEARQAEREAESQLRYEVIKTLKDLGWSAEKTSKALSLKMGKFTVKNFYQMIDDGHKFTFE